MNGCKLHDDDESSMQGGRSLQAQHFIDIYASFGIRQGLYKIHECKRLGLVTNFYTVTLEEVS